jgi:uncharacterized phage infection (PIP) family protein YhgE
MQAAPMGLRLFETQNIALVNILNSLVQFVAGRVYELAGNEPITVRHEPVKLADDAQRTQMIMQLASTGLISMGAGLDALGISYKDDMWRQLHEQKARDQMQAMLAEQQAKSEGAKQEMEILSQDPAQAQAQAQAQQGGQQAQPGMPPQPAPPPQGSLPSAGFRPPADVESWEEAAPAIAQVLMQLPPTQRQQEIRILREEFPTFHAVVMKETEKLKQAMGTQAVNQMMTGGGAMPA